MPENRMTTLEGRIDEVVKVTSKAIANSESFQDTLKEHFTMDKEAHFQVSEIHEMVSTVKTEVEVLKEKVNYTNGKVKIHTKILIALCAFILATMMLKPETSGVLVNILKTFL